MKTLKSNDYMVPYRYQIFCKIDQNHLDVSEKVNSHNKKKIKKYYRTTAKKLIKIE